MIFTSSVVYARRETAQPAPSPAVRRLMEVVEEYHKVYASGTDGEIRGKLIGVYHAANLVRLEFAG